MYLYSPYHDTFVGSGGKDVQGDGNNEHPSEVLFYVNDTGVKNWYYIQIKKVSGESRELKVNAYPYILEYTIPNQSSITSNQIFGHSAADGVISVAAYPADNQYVIEDYSSRGPTNIWAYPIGTFEERKTPTITATDKCSTSVAEYNPFTGTSAAAPHIAGIAALYYEKYGTLTNPQNFYNDLTDNADAIAGGTGGTWNNQSGYGKANAFEALGGGPLNVTINQLNSSLLTVGSIDHWENNNWVNYSNLPQTFQWDENSQHVLKATQTVISNEKYHDWFNDPNETYINHENFTITQDVNEIIAHLDQTKNAIIKTELTSGGSGGNIEFKDPWYEDYNEPPYGYRNRGTTPIWHTHDSPLNLTLASN